MLFVVICAIDLYYAMNHNKYHILRFNLLLTIVCSVFFFSSADPFIGLPLYFIFMMVTIVLAIMGYGKEVKIEKKNLIILLSIILVLLVPIVEILFNINQDKMLLINVSNTDVADLSSELRYPEFNFNLIKHFLFLVSFLLFLLCVKKLLLNNNEVVLLVNIIGKFSRVIFICIIFEWAIVNITGVNDRELMGMIFNIKDLNQTENWYTWGSNSVAFCFNERSGIGTPCLFFFFGLITEKANLKTLMYIVLAAVAVYCTGSSTGLVIVLVFSCVFVLKNIFLPVDKRDRVVALVLLILGIIVLSAFYQILFEKILNYLTIEEGTGSAYFRSNANKYAIAVISKHWVFGTGIGTLYCHSMILQTVGNIGIVGLILIIYYITNIINYKFKWKYLLWYMITILVFLNSSTLQSFTSPEFLMLFVLYKNISLHSLQKNNKLVKKYDGVYSFAEL